MPDVLPYAVRRMKDDAETTPLSRIRGNDCNPGFPNPGSPVVFQIPEFRGKKVVVTGIYTTT